MKLEHVLQPLEVEEFQERFLGRQCLLIKRNRNLFEDLLSLQEVETRLNDGVATLDGMSIIKPEGTKIPPERLRIAQPGRAWAANFRDKRQVRVALEEGHSIVMHNMSAINREVEELITDIEALGSSIQADVHLYISPRARGTGYHAHQDVPQHKLYLQLFGSTQWTVFKGHDKRRALPLEEARQLLPLDFEAKLTPGSILYMPPGVFHHATNPDGPRLSASIPFYPSQGATPVDRTRVDLVTRFEGA